MCRHVRRVDKDMDNEFNSVKNTILEHSEDMMIIEVVKYTLTFSFYVLVFKADSIMRLIRSIVSSCSSI